MNREWSIPDCSTIDAARHSGLLPGTRFTIDGSDGLEERLSRTCQNILSKVRSLIPSGVFQGLVLGGGYGRGEGGVLRTDAGDEPYNDLEFYVFLRGPRWLTERRYGAALHQMGHSLSAEAGVDIEFKILSVNHLHRCPPSMFYHDLMMGHRRLWGAEDFLAGCSRHCAAPRIPLAEATRLLMNRCSGLLFAKERLQRSSFTSIDTDFIARNLSKAQLAYGDVLLTVAGEYHWSCRQRAKRLKSLESDFPRFEEVRRGHTAGVQFKLHPEKSSASREALQKEHEEISLLGRDLWLWLENRRLNSDLQTVHEYALSAQPKCPETNPFRNCLINLRTFGPAVLLSSRAARYPRERILRTLPLLLWVSNLTEDARALRGVQMELRTAAKTFAELVQAYNLLWQRFS